MIIKANQCGGHFYAKDGTPCHFIEKKDGSGTRATTVADARKNGWLPSPTTILATLAKPALNEWLRQTAALAVLTTPRQDGEDIDSFVDRALSVDANSISDAAKERGTIIHDELEKRLAGVCGTYNTLLDEYVNPVISEVNKLGRVVMTEKVLVGDGYAGRVDCVVESESITVIDFKTTGAKKLPKKPYDEHLLQISAYCKALGNTGDKPIKYAVIYISSVRPGEVNVCEGADWQDNFELGFKPIMAYYKWSNNI